MLDTHPVTQGIFLHLLLYGAGDLAASETAGAHVNVFNGAVKVRLDFSDIGFPTSVGPAVRVRDVAAEGNALSAYRTLCHLLHLHKLLHNVFIEREQFNI